MGHSIANRPTGTRLAIPLICWTKENRKVALQTEAKMQTDSKTCLVVHRTLPGFHRKYK